MQSKYQSLKHYFPVIRTREEILMEIRRSPKLSTIFDSWTTEHQDLFLDICTGSKGVKMLYDSYFKEILNPETKPERLSWLLSVILSQKVTVKHQLANDNNRLGDEASLVITDIVVELEDGTIANIEVQKIGYKFAGERASCYMADLLMRQYKRIKTKCKDSGKKFNYKDVPPVYTIIFMESSPSVFKNYPNVLMHTFRHRSDSGLELKMLENCIFIPIDIFRDRLHNEGIKDDFDAWLTFLGCDDIEYISTLIEKYPDFKPMYQDLYDICLNVEEVMQMFSKELQELDHNTVIYMIDELQDQLDETKGQLDETKGQLDEAKGQLDEANATISEKDAAISMKDATIADLQLKIKELESRLSK